MIETGNDLTTIFDLGLDIKYIVLDYLENRDLANLAQTCKYFDMVVRHLISFRSAQVNSINQLMPSPLPFLNYRAGVAIGSTFYMPFINEAPFCYCFDLNTGIWSSHKLNFMDMNDTQPQITSASVIGTTIYLVCGRLIKSYTLSNAVIEIDTTNFNTRTITNAEGSPPRPRHEHSVDAIGDRYLIVFGGLCYNSVGENDVFVYDQLYNKWFVPVISGHQPHLRFGHASAVIGHNLYIHGGAQLDINSSYIVYDDLYKLDCKTWVWYKYEHPEVERYLRTQISTFGEPPQRDHLISTTGDNPFDRFQSYMCTLGNKLVVFGGHSIREDEDENEILCSYPLDEISVFHTKRMAWSLIHATNHSRASQDGVTPISDNMEEDDGSLTVSDMSVATISIGSRGIRVYIFAGQKDAEIPRTNPINININRRFSSNSSKSSVLPQSSSSNSSGYSPPSAHSLHATQHLPSITETTPDHIEQHSNDIEMTESDETSNQDDKSGNKEISQGDIRTLNDGDLSDPVKLLFQTEPSLEDREMAMLLDDEDHKDTPKCESSTARSRMKKSSQQKRPSISILHTDHSEESSGGGDSYNLQIKNISSSSHSSYSSNVSLGYRKNKHRKKAVPCTIIIDLVE